MTVKTVKETIAKTRPARKTASKPRQGVKTSSAPIASITPAAQQAAIQNTSAAPMQQDVGRT